MAEPDQNNIQWIDWWVNQNSQGMERTGTLKLLSPAPSNLPLPINEWQIYYTSANGNDCLIHSLLIDLSPTFRTLNQGNKDTIARQFRKGPFLNDVVYYYTVTYPRQILTEALSQNAPNARSAQQITEKSARQEYLTTNINSSNFLKQEFLKPLCLKFRFNVLFYSNIRGILPFDFEPNGDNLIDGPTIVMYNPDSMHFSAMSKKNGEEQNKFFLKPEDANNLKIEMIARVEALGNANPVCQFNYNDTIQNSVSSPEYNGWTVINRTFDNADPPICYQLELENPEKNEKVIVDINTLFPREYVLQQQQPQGSARGPSYSGVSNRDPRIGSYIPGRTSSFGPDFPDFHSDDDEPIILTNTLGTPAEQLQEQQESFDKTATGLALKQLRDNAIVTLNKLENFKWFFGSDIPKDCEVLKTGKFDKKIAERLAQFEDVKRSEGSPRGGGLLQKLYCGLTGEPNCPEINVPDLKTEITKLLKSPEICNLANVELMLEQAKKIQTDAEEFIDSGKVDPSQNPSKWRSLLKKTKLKTPALTQLINLLIGSNKLSALQKAANYVLPEDREALLKFENMETTKYLKEFLTTYKLSGFPIQIAFDFESVDIDDAFVKDIPQESAEERKESEFDFLNGKQFVKSMVTSMSFPTSFSLASKFVGTELNQKLVSTKEGDYYVTQKIPFLYESSQVFLSREITETVDRFEAFDKTPMDGATLSRVSLPLYIIFSCQKRKKGKDGNYLKKDGNFIYESFHTSIIFLCDGKIYTVGYGSDQVFDEENKATDTKIQYMNKISAFLKKKIPALENVQVLGTGFLYSPDSLNIDEDDYNYSIIDIGILKKSHVNRVNKVFAMIKIMRAITMVVDKAGKTSKSVTVEQMSAQTRCVYSRLGSKYLQNFQFSSQLMNCSSFVEAIFYDRIDCTTSLFYSDPNACKSKNFKDKIVPNGKPFSSASALIQTIFTSYFKEGTTLDSFKELVGYVPDVPEPVSLFNRVYNFITPPPQAPLVAGGNPEINTEIKTEIKLKKRRKHKRPKNSTAKKLSNK